MSTVHDRALQGARWPILGVVLGTMVPAGPVAAQETRADSLEVRVRRLETLVDSLVVELRRQRGAEAGQAEGARPEADELAVLRAAAAEAAEEAAAPPADTAGEAGSRTRNLNVLNPEISVSGDIVGGFLSPSAEDDRGTALPREFEFSFQAALDPFTRTKIFLSREEELEVAGLEEVIAGGGVANGAEEEEGRGSGLDLEEGYLYWVGLPGAIGVKAGRFRQELGLYNRWHTHALLEVERPLPIGAFMGDDGLIQTGASLTLPSFQIGPSTQTLTFETTLADNKLFEGGTDFSHLGRFQGFVDVSPSAYLQVGANGVYGHNDDMDLDATLFGVDVAFRWAPPAQARYRELTLKGEWYWADRDIGTESFSGNGGYAQASYRWDQRWITGFRADWLDHFGDDPTAFQLVPSVTWWQSEWVRLRLQYNYLKRAGLDADHTLLFQTVWAVGPHKHETY
jgi:hypothetical protein